MSFEEMAKKRAEYDARMEGCMPKMPALEALYASRDAHKDAIAQVDAKIEAVCMAATERQNALQQAKDRQDLEGIIRLSNQQSADATIQALTEVRDNLKAKKPFSDNDVHAGWDATAAMFMDGSATAEAALSVAYGMYLEALKAMGHELSRREYAAAKFNALRDSPYHGNDLTKERREIACKYAVPELVL